MKIPNDHAELEQAIRQAHRLDDFLRCAGYALLLEERRFSPQDIAAAALAARKADLAHYYRIIAAGRRACQGQSIDVSYSRMDGDGLRLLY